MKYQRDPAMDQEKETAVEIARKEMISAYPGDGFETAPAWVHFGGSRDDIFVRFGNMSHWILVAFRDVVDDAGYAVGVEVSIQGV